MRATSATILLMAILSISPTDANAKKFYLYGDRANGSNFKQKIYQSDVPLRKSFSKMKPKYQDMVRANYPELASADTPPFPKRGLAKIIKPYLKRFYWAVTQSTGTYLVKVNASGEVTDIAVENVTNSQVEDTIKKLIFNTKFESGTCSGTPCDGEFIFRMSRIGDPSRDLKLKHKLQY